MHAEGETDRQTDGHDGNIMCAFRDNAKALNSLATFFFFAVDTECFL